MTAVDRVDSERIDHQGFVPEIFAGLLATAFWMMQYGPSIASISDYIEDWMALALFFGSVACLLGVVIGTKFSRMMLPHAGRRTAYVFQLVGLPPIIGTLGLLTYASVDPNNLVISALAGGLGLCVEIGCLRLFVDLIQELRDGCEDEDENEDHGND